MGDVETWYQAARLLRGEVLTGTWSGVGLHLNPGQEPPTGVQQGALFNNPYSVRIGGRDYPLGVVTMQVATVRVDETRPPVRHGDHLDVQFVPGDDSTMTIRLNPAGPGMPGIPASVPSSS